MKSRILRTIIIFIVMLLMIADSSKTFAITEIPDNTIEREILVASQIKPENLTGEKPSGVSDSDLNDLDFVKKLENVIKTIGIFIAIGVLMIIGIKYMMGSIEEKATYKKTMLPYIIGCILLFGAATISPTIIEFFEDITEPEETGNAILGLIQVIGTFISVAVIMILGIKYMLGSVEERASYKRSMLPFLIGAVILFTAVHLVSFIYDKFSLDEESTEEIETSHYELKVQYTDLMSNQMKKNVKNVAT